MATLSIKNLHKSFNNNDIIKGLNLNIQDREFVVFVGPSGCGKSTLLRLIAGLEEVTHGTIELGDHDITHEQPAKRQLAMVFQSYALYPHMTVYDNMAFALKLEGEGLSKEAIKTKVNEAAKVLELSHLLDRKPKALSGGQRQRVAIGRAIVRAPKLFLFDEPLSNLDAALRAQMRLELARLHQTLNATMIYVTHDQVEAMTLADKVVVLNKGKIEQVGSPLELYNAPVNKFVAGFLGTPTMNFLEGRVELIKDGQTAIKIENEYPVLLPAVFNSLQSEEPITLGIRPEHIHLTHAQESHLTGTLEVIEHLGSDTLCHIRLNSQKLLTLRTNGDFSQPAGTIMKINIDLGRYHIFNQEGFTLSKMH